MSKKAKLFAGGLFVVVVLVSFAVRSYSVFKRGYAPAISAVELSTAKNMALANTPYLETQNHTVLSTDSVKEKGTYASNSNQLTTLLYSKIFKYWKFDTSLPTYIAIAIWAIVSGLLFTLVWHLFDLKLALLFSLVEIFMPFVFKGAILPGAYEFTMLFFTIGLMFYLWREKQTWQEVALAGIFFTLAVWARNTFIISLAALFVYDIFKNKSFKRVIYLVLPFILVGTAFWQMNIQKGIPNPALALNMPAGIKAYFSSVWFYLKAIWDIIILGGPIFVLLILSGLVWLFRKNKQIFAFCLTWFFVWYLLQIGFKTYDTAHYLEIAFPLILAAAAGAYLFISCIVKQQRAWIVRVFVAFILCIAITWQLGMSLKWLIYKQYDGSMAKVMSDAETVKQIEIQQPEMFNDETIIAIGSSSEAAYEMNYLTDKSYIYVAPEKLIELAQAGTLEDTIGEMKIAYFIGYGDEISYGLYQMGFKVLLP